MEGYLYKRGHTLPTMQRRYCVLKGTMLAYYTSQDEYHRRLTPRNVLEVVAVREWDGATALRTYRHGFEVDYLGGTTYQCHADSREEKQQWLDALQHALDEPDRIVQDEIEEAQRHLQQEADHQEQAMSLAADAVERAQHCSQEAAEIDEELRTRRSERSTVDEQLRDARVLLDEAQRRRQHTAHALERARHHAHDAALAEGALDSDDDDAVSENDDTLSRRTARSAREQVTSRIERLAAQLEVDSAHEATNAQAVAQLESRLAEIDAELEALSARARECAAEGQQLRDAAATSLQRAQSAKQLARLRVSSWAGTTSHLDPLAEGYLLCKHPVKPSMHRRYYVLYGNTLCWYKDADDYAHRLERPSGVVHVAAVAEWNGRVGGLKTFPHSFAVVTVEGKTLYCAAPMRQSAVAWDAALHIGLTMPPLSPHRAVAAKARRDSFDLLSTMQPSTAEGAASTKARRASMAHVAMTGAGGAGSPAKRAPRTLRSQSDAVGSTQGKAKEKAKEAEDDVVVVEGYLVKKSALVPVMKKKYCVLRRLRLAIYDSHEAYAAACAAAADEEVPHKETLLVCGVSDWDGHGALLQYHHGFEVHTAAHASVFCSAASAQEKSKWVAGIHAALLKFHDAQLSPVSREDALIAKRQHALLSEVHTETESTKEEDDEKPTAQQRLRQCVQQLYAQHNPSKLGEVPLLLERFRGRERALLEHLDRIYGTTLASAPETLELLQALAQEEEQKQKQRRETTGVRSGLLEFVKMTGRLQWTSLPSTTAHGSSSSSKSWSFCVLSVDKLVRYASETQYETEPFAPLEMVKVLRVTTEREHASETQFVISCRDRRSSEEDDDDGDEEEEEKKKKEEGEIRRVLLEAPSADQRVLWVAKLRSGLGVAASAAHDAHATGEEDDRRTAFRRQLIAFYEQHNPRKLGDVDALLHYFSGRESQLLRDLDATYGTRTSDDPTFAGLLPLSPVKHEPTDDPQPQAQERVHMESYAWVRHDALGSASFRRSFCVLRDETWSCFASSHDAHAQRPPLLSDVVTDVHAVGAKLHALRVLSLETQQSGVVLLRLELDQLVTDWTHALRRAADLSLERLGQQQPTQEQELNDGSIPESHRALLLRLEAFYETHHPDRKSDAARLVAAFLGRERALLEEIDRIYHSHLASDATVLALLPPEAFDREEEEDGDADENEEILMEGYLIKRGHLVPSMRKRYCVLVRNVLTYYATHEDSRDPRVTALGSFRVEIVSDWHGRTTTQTYAHGLELETHDGKTFFCAALSADDKRQWMAAFQRALALERQQQQQTEEQQEDDVDDATRTRRRELHARLTQFYETHNPSKLADLALLLACYRGRELAMLEAIDATYGTQLATDDALLALLPPQDAHTLARQRLEYDGALHRAASDSDASWRHAQQLHVALRRLALSFFATREGFKAGLALPSEHAQSSVTVLAVKRLTPVRFAVETTEHAWMFFEAPNAVEGAHWLEMLQSALDAELAASILQDETAKTTRGDVVVSCRGYLTVKMDFMAALHAFRALENSSSSAATASASTLLASYAPNAMVECFAVLRNGDELVLFDAAQHDAAHEIAALTVLSTRPWTDESSSSSSSSLSSAITASFSLSTKSKTESAAPASSSSSHRFPFQVLTQEQIVLSVCAATDGERAKWIQRIRVAAERARALELLAEQRDDVEHSDSTEPAADDERHVASHSNRSERRRRGSVLDEASGHVRGYLLFAVGDARREDVREGFVVLDDRAGCRVFEDEAAFLTQQAPVLEGQATELETHARLVTASVSPSAVASRVARLFSGSSSPKKSASSAPTVVEELSAEDEALAFRVTLGDEEPQTLTLLPASHEERELWVAAFSHGLDLLQGEQLLRDEKLVLELEAKRSHHEAIETTHEPLRLVVPHAAMEGELTPWHSSLSLSVSTAREHAGPPFFAVLVGCHLRGFPSRDIAVEAANSDVLAASPDLELLSVADWTPPSSSSSSSSTTAQDDGETSGFQVTAIRKTTPATATATASGPPPTSSTWRLTAPTPAIKRQWVHAIKHELDFALAERYLDDEALEFARLAAQHLATTVSAASNASASASSPSAPRIEGYVRVRHQSLGAMWRERFAVALGTTLFLFEQGSDALADDWTRRAVERHELLRAESWHAPPPALRSMSLSSAAQRQLHRHGLRLENHDGALLECTFATEDDREHWLKTLTTALEAAPPQSSLAASERLATRDVALPFVPGAAMEGYLHVRVRERERGLLSHLRSATARWKTRYGVLLGVQLLLYATQEQAVALHGHNSQSQSVDTPSETAEATTDSQDVLPQAVYEVLHAENWRAPEGKSTSDPELETHAFVVAATKGSSTNSSSKSNHSTAVGDVLECKAHTSLERKRWLDAMEDQVTRSREEQALVAHALQEHGDRERAKLSVKDKLQALQADASRASMVIQDVLNSFASTALSSESDAGSSSDSESDIDAQAQAQAQGSGSRRPTALPGPKTWRRSSLGLGRRSPENSPLYHSQSQHPLTEAEMEEHELRYVEFPASPPAKRTAATETSWWSALTGCCLGLPASGSAASASSETAMAMASIAPLHNTMYRYDCYHEDTPVWLPERMDDV